MDYQVEEISITDKLVELGLAIPESLAFMPENLNSATAKEDFIFTDSLVDLNKLFRQKNLGFDVLGGDTELYRTRKNADMYLPAVFLSIIENPLISSVVLNILSSYVYDSLKGIIGKKTVHVELYIELGKKGKIKKISYNGDADKLKDLENVIKALK